MVMHDCNPSTFKNRSRQDTSSRKISAIVSSRTVWATQKSIPQIKKEQVKTKSIHFPCPSYVYVTWVFSSSSDKWGVSIIVKLGFPFD
jgi:hypothetical protein